MTEIKQKSLLQLGSEFSNKIWLWAFQIFIFLGVYTSFTFHLFLNIICSSRSWSCARCRSLSRLKEYTNYFQKYEEIIVRTLGVQHTDWDWFPCWARAAWLGLTSFVSLGDIRDASIESASAASSGCYRRLKSELICANLSTSTFKGIIVVCTNLIFISTSLFLDRQRFFLDTGKILIALLLLLHRRFTGCTLLLFSSGMLLYLLMKFLNFSFQLQSKRGR